MPSRIPEKVSLSWLVGHRDVIRDQMRYTDQHRGALIVTPSGAIRPGLYSHGSHNVVYDLRDVETSAEPAPIQSPILAVAEDDPNQELDVTWSLPEIYDELLLERSPTDITAFTLLATLAGNAVNYDDAAVTPGTEYFYRIRGRVGGAYSAYSNIDSGLLVASGGLHATGWTGYGQYGNGSTTDLDELAEVSTEPFVKIATGLEFSAGIKADGTLWTTGRNLDGQLGQGDHTQRTSWTQVGSDTNWADVVCGEKFMLARKTTGAIYACGNNDFGQLGQGDTTERTTLTQIGAATTWTFIAVGDYHSIAINSSNELFNWGHGEHGQLGDDLFTDTHSPIQVPGSWTHAGAGEFFTLAVNTAGELWGWGDNFYGQLGTGGTVIGGEGLPVQEVTAATNWSKVCGGERFSVALKTDGTIHSTGQGTDGQLGQGGTTSLTTFTQIGAATTYDQIVGCQVSMRAHRSDGTIWGWGQNGFGELGLNDFADRTTPTQIGVSTDNASIHSRYYTTFVIKN